jgi:hypothetical protein
LAKIGKNWQKLAKIGKNWQKLAKIGKKVNLIVVDYVLDNHDFFHTIGATDVTRASRFRNLKKK